MGGFRVLAAMVCAGTLASAGGCGVIEVDDAVSAKEAQVRAAGVGRFDLTAPPSRDEAGMLEGRNSASYTPESGEPLHLELTLPEGRRLVGEMDRVRFVGELGDGGGSTAPPESLEFSRHDLKPADARDQLQRYAKDLHLDTGSIRSWYSKIEKRQVARTDPVLVTGWIRNTLGYLTVTMQGEYNLIGNLADVSFRLTWRNP